MVSPAKAAVMSLLLSRTSRTQGFPLVQLHWKSAGRKHTVVGHVALKESPRISSVSFNHSFQRTLFSSTTPQSSDKDTMGIPQDLQNCLNRFVDDGSLSQDESTSIRRALFYSHVGRNLLALRSMEDNAEIIKISIASYLVQKTKRKETGMDPVANPGTYLRSIFKKRIELIGAETTAPSAIKKNCISEKPNHLFSANEETRTAIYQDEKGVSDVLELLRFYNIQQDELSESCLHALTQHPVVAAKYALETYAKQKKRRESNGMDEIESPSSYVMAVLRYVLVSSNSLCGRHEPS